MTRGRHRRRHSWWPLRERQRLAALGVSAVVAATATTSTLVLPRHDDEHTGPIEIIARPAPLRPRVINLKAKDYEPPVVVAPPVAAPPPAPVPSEAATVPLPVVPVPPPPPAPSTGRGEQLVYLASLEAGKPYLYGAEGPDAFDCSGLVQYVYGKLGISIPRTTQTQFAAATRIARGSEQRGDLIFFGSPSNIYHMGIYAGNGQMWAAPRSGEVVSLRTIWGDYYVGRI